MRLILPTLAAILTFSGAAHAQISSAISSAMGATSPLGVPGATSDTGDRPASRSAPRKSIQAA